MENENQAVAASHRRIPKRDMFFDK